MNDPFLRLRDSAGNSITFNDDNGVNLNSRISYAATSSDTYYLSVGSATSGGIGTYRVSAADVTVSDDFAGSTATTGAMSVGGSTTGNIETAGDTDWFRISLFAGRTYQFDLQGNPTGQGTLPDPFLRLRDSAGTSLAFNDDNGTNLNSRIVYTATTTDTFYLSAGSATTGGTGTYRVNAADVTLADDYASSTATTGTVSVGGSITGSIENVGDTDWFRISLVAGHIYQFDLQGSATGQGTLSDPFLRLRDSAGTSLAFNDDNDTNFNSRITYAATSTDTFYLSAGAANTGGTGTYRISAVDANPNDDYVGSTATAGTVSVGGSTKGNIEIPNDTDWFRVSLAAGHTYEFDLQGSSTNQGTLSDPFLRLRDSAGNSITSNDDNGVNVSGVNFNSRIFYTPKTSDTYYLSVGAANTGGTGTYKVSADEATTSQVGSSGGIVFNNTFTAACTQDYIRCVEHAENFIASSWTNSITLNLEFDGSSSLPSNVGGTNVPYSFVAVSYADLMSKLPSSDKLPPNNPIPGSTNSTADWYLPEAYARMLGLSTLTPTFDDIVVLNTGVLDTGRPWDFAQDVVNVIEHEITEGGMGRIGGDGLSIPTQTGVQNNVWGAPDLFHYTAASPGSPGMAKYQNDVTTYFSADGGITTSSPSLPFYTAGQGDTADFNAYDVFGANPPGNINLLSQTDQQFMDVLGWTPAGSFSVGPVLVDTTSVSQSQNADPPSQDLPTSIASSNSRQLSAITQTMVDGGDPATDSALRSSPYTAANFTMFGENGSALLYDPSGTGGDAVATIGPVPGALPTLKLCSDPTTDSLAVSAPAGTQIGELAWTVPAPILAGTQFGHLGRGS